MKLISILSLVVVATLVSAGVLIPSGPQPDLEYVPDAYIFQEGFNYARSGIFLNVKINLAFDIRHQFDMFNGISIKVKSGHTGDDLAGLEGVKRVWPIDPSMTTAHQMTGVDYAVVDSGIDYTHPAFGGCTGLGKGEGCRVVAGWDYIGDEFDKTGVVKEDAGPIDHCGGHGIHVAGIIGADARNVGAPQPFVGAAPGVILEAYKISSCGKGGSFELAMRDVWKVEECGLGSLSTSAASFDNIAGSYNYFSYDGVEYPYLSSTAWGKPLNLTASATLVPILKDDGSLSDGCTAESYASQDVKGKVVLVISDTSACKSGVRGAAAAKTAGAAGMLVQSTPFGLRSVSGSPELAMASIEGHTSRALLVAHEKSPTPTLQWFEEKKSFMVEGGDTPSDFSSWGFDGDLHIKPEIAASGGNILSTYPQQKGGYTVMSGTSMATPCIAGAHALLFEAHKKVLRGQGARQILMKTAIPGSFFNDTEIAPVAKQGGGLINIKNVIAAKSVDVTIKNFGDAETRYTLSHGATESAISYRDGNTFPLSSPILENDDAVISFSLSQVTVAAGQSATITIQFQEPSTGQASEFPFYSGYIVATPQGQDAIPVHIPYAGIKGDIAQVPILDTDSGFPSFAVRNKTSGQTGPTRLGSHTPELSLRLYDAEGKLAGYLDTPHGIAASNSGRSGNLDANNKPVFKSTLWKDGNVFVDRNATTSTKPLPVVVAAQHKLSKGEYSADFEIYEVAVVEL
ncbi:MAG: peptidase S8/S53 domain-containing protein [Benniella sp.]|nr:MAG: peptidase S8/S53 domain-containing protein [Benniella sp.]